MNPSSLAAALIAFAALFAAASPAAAQGTPTKKELVQKLLRLQQADIEGFARSVVERPAVQMLREAGQVLQQQSGAPEKREATSRAIEAEVKKYVDDAYPLVRDRAIKLAPSTIGAVFEAKMSEDELKALIGWLESPTAKKYQQIGNELRAGFTQKLLADMPGLLDPKLHALDERVRVLLGLPLAGAGGAAAPGPGPGAGTAPAPRPASK